MYYQYRTQRVLYAVIFFFAFSIFADAQNPEPNSLSAKSANISLDEPSNQAQIESTNPELAGLNLKNPVIWNNLAAIYAKQLRFEDAVTALRKSIEINPNRASAYVNLSIVYDRMNRTDDALLSARRAVEVDGKSVRARTQLCDLTFLAKKNAEALSCYEELRKLEPMDPITKANYGASLLINGNLNAATPVLEEAVAQLPAYSGVRNALGVAYFRKKKYSASTEMFKKAIELNPDRDEYRFNLAVTQMASGNKPAVLSQYNLLKDSNPELAGKIYKLLYSGKILFVENK